MDDAEHSIGGTEIRAISDGYFEAMRIPILLGRGFLQTDEATTSPVALVNETLAQRWWGSTKAIGQQVVIGKFRGRDIFQNPTPREIVGAFAGIALALAAIGIYGVLSLFVLQRTHEIGIRVALGAQQREVLRLVVGQGLRLGLTGVVIGTAMAVGLSRFLSSLLYQIKPTSSLPYLVSAAVSVAVAILASYIPAR